MDEEIKAKITDIETRWEGNMKSVCPSCMYDCIRHWDRNEECQTPYENSSHPGRYDGEVYAEAGADIKTLLDIIKKLTENEKGV